MSAVLTQKHSYHALSLPRDPSLDNTYKCIEDARGIALVDSLGVRGVVFYLQGETDGDRASLLKEGLDHLRDIGVKRVHVFARPGSTTFDAAEKSGFQICAGETLFRIKLAAEPTLRTPLAADFTLRNGTNDDLNQLLDRLTAIPEIAFQEWEIPLIRDSVYRSGRIFKVVACSHDIVGFSIGGSSGGVGTITHLWVHENFRCHGLGHALSEASLVSLYQANSEFVHLMTTPGNRRAELFWEHQGFTAKNPGELVFLERDL